MIRDRKKKFITRFFSLNPHIRWALLVLIVVVFTTGLYPGLVIKKHHYTSGDVVKSDIKASEDFFIEDHAATEVHRRQAVERVDVHMGQAQGRYLLPAVAALAAIVAHHGLAPARANLLLDEYFAGDGARWRSQLASYERFYNAILWLWQAARVR